jgi:hypothetical protein
MEGMRDIRQSCSGARDTGACFVKKMEEQGAPRQAVSFAKLTGNTGYMRDFRDTGRVDVAYVNYPFRANENQGWLLVNGSPQTVDVDDYNITSKAGLSNNPRYTALARRYPNVAIFPGDRSGTNFPIARNLPGGGQRFVVAYKLVDGCHACNQIGTLKLAFDFDRGGRFTGASFHEMN